METPVTVKRREEVLTGVERLKIVAEPSLLREVMSSLVPSEKTTVPETIWSLRLGRSCISREV